MQAGCKLYDLDDELWCGPDRPVNASRGPVLINGQQVYAAVFEGGMGYRLDNASGVATGDDPETIYMVVSGKHYNDRCCCKYYSISRLKPSHNTRITVHLNYCRTIVFSRLRER